MLLRRRPGSRSLERGLSTGFIHRTMPPPHFFICGHLLFYGRPLRRTLPVTVKIERAIAYAKYGTREVMLDHLGK